MSVPLPPSSESLLIRLLRKLVLLALLMVTVALGLMLMLRQISIFSIFLPQVLVTTAMGLAAGLSTRWVLHGRTALLRISAVLAFLVGGLELLGWFTGWQLGLAPLQVGRAQPDWFSLGQLVLGFVVALLSLFAWGAPALEPVPAPIPDQTAQRLDQPPKPHTRRKPRASLPAPASVPPAEVVLEAPPSRPKRRRSSAHKPKLQVSSEEEHRCPYCLEPVLPDDPRGTVECQICHTLHHADCWAITGACQVPHYTN